MIKKLFLNKSKLLTVLVFLFAFSVNVSSQAYTITGNVNASTLSCVTFGSNNIINIGNGTLTPSSLIMNDDLNLALPGCSTNPLQIIVNNGTIDFSTANKRLYLPEGSSISFLNGGTLKPSGGNGGGCTGNDRIYIGGIILATCQGGAGIVSFEDIIAFEGSGSATSNSPVCVGNPIILSATPPPKGGPFTYIWYETSSPNTPIGTGQSITITSSTSGSHIYQVKMYSESLNKTMIANAVVLVNSGSTTASPTVDLTQPTCTLATGTITISAPAGNGMKYSINGLNYTNSTSYIVNPGTYSVTAKNSSGCISSETSVTISSQAKTWNGSVSTDWNTAANWTPSGVPTSSNCVTIPNTARPSIISGTNFVAYANTLTLLTSGRLTVNSSNTITVTDFVNVGLGFLVFEDTASLVQINNVNNNSGFIDYKRLTAARPTDYTYWSSPVSPMTLGELYPLGSTFYSYEVSPGGEDWSLFDAGTDMVPGKGYIANRGAAIPSPGSPPPPGLLNVTFAGVPNNGHYEIDDIYANKSYLLGNPYPSALDANEFLAANEAVLNGTLYFWTHNTQIGIGVSDPGTGLYAYSGDDYATYNATGGVGAAPPDLGVTTGPAQSGNLTNNNNTPSGKIASGQGFFASSKTSLSGNKIVFDNIMRVGVNGITGNNSQFFKTKNPNKSTKTIEKNRIWLNLTNTQGAFKQTLIGYITDATNDYDDRFDGESFDGNEFVDFYSLNQDKNLVIQGRALPFDDADEVQLGFRTTINGAFTISINQVDGFLTHQSVFIEDKWTNTLFDLKSGKYTFNTVPGTFDNRFVLRYTNNSSSKTLETTNFNSLGKTVLVSNKNKHIKIESAAEMIENVAIYDLLGKQIYQKDNVNSNELSISNLVPNRQMLMVKTVLQNGETVSNKIIY